jgi:SsrA-binding protein
MSAPQPDGDTTVVTNRKARHDYHVLESIEAGLVLTGTEVKSLRQRRANLTDGYARLDGGEMWLHGMHVSPYEQGSYANVDPVRKRKLLLHRDEIRRLAGKVRDKGMTLIPLRVYFRKNRAKVELGVCRGKKSYDKREDIARRETERDIRRTYAR